MTFKISEEKIKAENLNGKLEWENVNKTQIICWLLLYRNCYFLIVSKNGENKTKDMRFCLAKDGASSLYLLEFDLSINQSFSAILSKVRG